MTAMNVLEKVTPFAAPCEAVNPHAAYFEEILNAVPLGMVLLGEDGLTSKVNDALAQLYCCERDELLGADPALLFSDAIPKRWFDEQIKFSNQLGAGSTHELEAVARDGAHFPAEVHISGIETAEGRRTILSIRDISERNRQRNSFRQVFHAAPYGMLMLDADGEIKFVNSAAAGIFGYAADALESKSIYTLLPERYRAKVGNFWEVFLTGAHSSHAFRMRDLYGVHSDGTEIPLQTGLSHIETAQGPRFVMAVVEIAKRKTLELDLRQANSNLEEFTYVASHDLKSPLRGLADLINWIEEDIAEGNRAKVEHNLGRVRIRVERLEQVITDLLEYARAGMRSTNFEKIDIHKMLAEIVELQPHPPGFEISVRSEVDGITAVKTPLETVLRNLLSNAVNHHDREDGKVEFTVREEDDYCVFRVADDGPGIPEAAQERVFKLFQTMTMSERSGGGLGLALAKRLVEGHEGRITLESNGRGAVFQVWWPRYQRRVGE
jgi:PAS domain S-box-containing protein